MHVYAVCVYHETWTCINLDLHSEEWHQSEGHAYAVCVCHGCVVMCMLAVCVCIVRLGTV